MPSTLTLVLMVIFFLESLAAMLLNGFMASVLGREWVRSWALPAADMIVACIASSRFCLHGTAVLNNLLDFFGFCHSANFLNILWDCFNTLLLWFTAWLAMVYCVKISTFSHPIFSWLKWRISRLVSRLLLGSLIIGGVSAIMTTTRNVFAIQMISQSSYGNCTFHFNSLTLFWNFYFVHAVFFWFPPFFLFLVSIILLVFSLHQHIGRMKDVRSGSRDPSTQAHTLALKSLAFFFISYTLYFLLIFLSFVKIKAIQSSWYWAKEMIIYTGIFLHSIILVLSSSRLKKALKMRFWGFCPSSS